MKIILKKEVANLGDAGDVVEVKSGYALNYLIPQGFAVSGTKSALKQHEETIRQRAHREAKLVGDAEAVAAKLSASPVRIAAKVAESGKLYGAVSAAMVAEALAAAGLQVDKKDITLPEIKEAGEFEGTVKVYKKVVAPIKEEVIKEEEAAPAAE